MEAIQGITIPTKPKSIETILEDIRDNMAYALTPEEEEWYATQKKNKKLEEARYKIQQLQMKYVTPVMYKMKQKLTKTYDRYLANGQWFKASLNAFKNLGQKAGHWLMDILKFIFLLAIFDPKGKFLNSIVDFILSMVVWFIKILTKFLPKIIKTMIFIITDVIPPVLKKIVNVLSDAIYEMFTTWTNSLPEDSILRKVMEFIKEGFGENGIIRKFFVKLADFFPMFLIVLGALKLISVLAPVFSLLGSAVSFLIPALTTIVSLLTTIVSFIFTSVLPTLGMLFFAFLPFIAIGAALLVLWKFSEEIANFFDGLIDRFKKLSVVGKIFAVALALLLWPITSIGAAIYGIVKLFQWIKNTDFSKLFDSIKTKISNFFSSLWGNIPGGIDNIKTAISNFFSSLWDKIKLVGELFYKISLPLRLFVNGIKGLINIFKMFKKFGAVQTFKILGQGIAGMAKSAKKWASTNISNAWESVKGMATGISNKVQKGVGIAINWGKDFINGITKGMRNAWDYVVNSSFGKWLGNFLGNINDSFTTFLRHPLKGGDPNRDKLASQLENVLGVNAEQIEKAYTQNIGLSVLDKIRKDLGKDSKDIYQLSAAIDKLSEKMGRTEATKIIRTHVAKEFDKANKYVVGINK